MSLEIILNKSKLDKLQVKIISSILKLDYQLLARFKIADEYEKHSELIFYQNSNVGIKQVVAEKNMLPQVVQFFNKFYEIKY